MKPAQPQDKDRVVDLLSTAFDTNKSVNGIVMADGKRVHRIRHLMGYAFDICLRYGRVYLSNDRNACALLVFPELKKITFYALRLDLALIAEAIGWLNLGRALTREKRIKAVHPRERMAYLWFIGVDPNFQYAGVGKKLMNELIEAMENENRPIYLETSTTTNLPWYQKFGFEIYHLLNLGYELHFLRRKLEWNKTDQHQ